jgi:hypothetical protein
MTIRRLALVFALGLAACGGGGDDGSGNGDGGAGNGDGGGNGNGDGGNLAQACKKIDLVISVDPSGSMSQELAAMSGIFGDFAGQLLTVSDEFENFRTGVVDACPRPATFNTRGQGGECNFQSGESWIDSASPDMVGEYQCVGDIDKTFDCNTSNDEDEEPIKAAIAALQPGINPGFVRDDALLVVVAITDEDEEMILDDQTEEVFTPSELAANASGLYDSLVAAKGGDVKRMVFVGIAGGLPDGCQNGTYGSAKAAPIMGATSDLFIAQQRGVKWDICQGSLDQALGEALTVITQACAEFPPVE